MNYHLNFFSFFNVESRIMSSPDLILGVTTKIVAFFLLQKLYRVWPSGAMLNLAWGSSTKCPTSNLRSWLSSSYLQKLKPSMSRGFSYISIFPKIKNPILSLIIKLETGPLFFLTWAGLSRLEPYACSIATLIGVALPSEWLIMSGLDCERSTQYRSWEQVPHSVFKEQAASLYFSSPSHCSWPSKFSKIGHLTMELQGVPCNFLESTVLAKKLSVQSHAAIQRQVSGPLCP